MSWIRWWGLGAFVAIVGGAFALWLLFADTFVRWGIEAAGTRMVGAQVELASADASFSPARLELRGLAITNPDEPMRNALEAERIAFDIDWIGLLLDRVQIDTVSLEGLRFGTERESSGAVVRTRHKVRESSLIDRARERAEIPPLEVPSVQTVLERESLRSPAVIAEAGETIEQRRKALDRRLGELPGKSDMERYRGELDEATADGGSTADRLKRLKKLKELVERIEDDVKALRKARDEVRQSAAAARDAVAEARKAPRDDLERLYRKYTDPRAVSGELAHYLLGPKVTGWINQGWYWYDRLSPYLGRGADEAAPEAVPATRNPGRNIVYPQAGEKPRVLVRQVAISGAAGGGDLEGRVTDIAMPATRWPEPLRARLTGNSLGGIGRLRVNASVDRRSAGNPVSRIDLQAGGTDVSGFGLGPESRLRAERGSADFNVNGTVSGRELALDLGAVLTGLSFTTDEDVQPILREVAAALGGAGRLDIGATVRGTIDEPELNLKSSLEGLIEPILRNRLKQAAAGFREELASTLTERTGGSLDELEQAVADIEDFEAQLKERLDGFEAELKKARKKLD